MLKAGVGSSVDSVDAKKAGQEACQQAVAQLGEKPNLLVAFASPVFNQEETVAGIRSVAPEAILVGCSSAGEITTAGSKTKSAVVMALVSDRIKFKTGVAGGVGADSLKAGREAAEQIKSAGEDNPALLVSFLEGLTGNGAAIVRGLQAAMGEHLPIIGGSAGDDFAFKKTFQYHQDKVLNDSVVALSMSGNFAWGVGVRHGWEPIGLPMKVTKAEGAVLKELDGQPALKIYENVFGAQAEDLIKEPLAWMAYTYPLGMSVEGSSELLIRDVIIANDKGEITCAAEIPQGAEVRLMMGDVDKALGAAKEAAENALRQLKGAKPKAILIFNCVARFKLLTEERISDEIKEVQKVLGEDVPLIGFYTYGEQAPLGGDINSDTCRSAFHNETMALLVLGE